MNKQDIAEQPYTNGYAQGVKDMAEKLRKIAKVNLEVYRQLVVYIGDINGIVKELTEVLHNEKR